MTTEPQKLELGPPRKDRDATQYVPIARDIKFLWFYWLTTTVSALIGFAIGSGWLDWLHP